MTHCPAGSTSAMRMFCDPHVQRGTLLLSTHACSCAGQVDDTCTPATQAFAAGFGRSATYWGLEAAATLWAGA